MKKQTLTYLDRNEFNYEPAPEVKKAIKDFDPGSLCFYTRIFTEGKKSIFSDFIAQQFNIPEEQIILGYGGEDILKQVVHYYLSRGEKPGKLLIPSFSWWYYKSIADEVNGQTVFYPLVEDADTFRYDAEAFRTIIRQEKPEAIVIASPNNPTGNALTIEELRQMLSEVPQDCIAIIDEAYASFSNRDTDYLSQLIEEFPNCLIIRTLSKFYGLPGLRLGFAFRGKALNPFVNYSTKYLGFNRFSEEIGIAAIKATEYYENIAEKMAEDRDYYKATLGPLEGFKVYRSIANFILVKYPTALKDALKQALSAKGLVVKFMQEPGLESHMRITLGTSPQNHLVADTIKEVANANL